MDFPMVLSIAMVSSIQKEEGDWSFKVKIFGVLCFATITSNGAQDKSISSLENWMNWEELCTLNKNLYFFCKKSIVIYASKDYLSSLQAAAMTLNYLQLAPNCGWV